MIRKLFLIAVIAFLSGCSDEDSKNMMTVKGEIKGLKKGMVFLQHIPDSVLITIDSIKVDQNGRFELKSEITEPELFYLYLKKADQNELNDRVSFFGEPGVISANSTWNGFEQDMEISGSVSNDVLEEYRKVMTRFNSRDLELLQASISDSISRDSLLLDSLQKASDANLLRRYLYTINFALNNRGSYIAPYLAVTETPDANIKYLDSVYNVLPDSIAASKYGKHLKELLEDRKNNQ